MPRMSPFIRSFRQMLGLASRGDFTRQLDEEMQACIEALEAMPGDKGKATMTITVDYLYELGRIDVEVKVKTKLPETKKFMRTPFFVHEGLLSVEHPNQIDMFTREVDGKRVADADDGDETGGEPEGHFDDTSPAREPKYPFGRPA